MFAYIYVALPASISQKQPLAQQRHQSSPASVQKQSVECQTTATPNEQQESQTLVVAIEQHHLTPPNSQQQLGNRYTQQLIT